MSLPELTITTERNLSLVSTLFFQLGIRYPIFKMFSLKKVCSVPFIFSDSKSRCFYTPTDYEEKLISLRKIITHGKVYFLLGYEQYLDISDLTFEAKTANRPIVYFSRAKVLLA